MCFSLFATNTLNLPPQISKQCNMLALPIVTLFLVSNYICECNKFLSFSVYQKFPCFVTRFSTNDSFVHSSFNVQIDSYLLKNCRFTATLNLENKSLLVTRPPEQKTNAAALENRDNKTDHEQA